MTRVHSTQTSAPEIVYTGPHLDLQVTDHYLNPYRLPPAQLILSCTGYQVFYLLGHIIIASLRQNLSLMIDRNRLQRLRVSALLLIPVSILKFQNRDPSCLASLSSAFKSWDVISQHWSSQVTRVSLDWWLKSFCISCSLPRDRDQVIISGSSSCCKGPPSSSSLTEGTDLVLDFFSGIMVTATKHHKLFL